MICVSVAEPTLEACLAALDGLEFAEVRIDKMTDARPEDMPRLFSSDRPMIVTCRPGPHPEILRGELLTAAIEAGAAYADIELEAEPGLLKAVAETVRTRSARLIISYHNHESTPPGEELRGLRESCFESGADIAKLACRVLNPRDAARLLGLLDDPRSQVVVGMGELGKIVRAAAPLLGGVFTFAAKAPGKETADGQLDRSSLERILRELTNL